MMETATIAELKSELKNYSENELMEICLRLAKFKKTNKELLHYLVMEASSEELFVEKAKEEIRSRFREMPHNSLFLSTKYIRKTLRIAKQYGTYSKVPQTGMDLLLCFCEELKAVHEYWKNYQALESLFRRQVEKIRKDIQSLHEDLQYDYEQELRKLDNPFK